MHTLRITLIAASLALALPCAAHDYSVGALKIVHPWARATPNGAIAGAGYLTITNTGKTPERLTGGSTPIAGKFEIHEMSMTGGVMRMRPVAGGLVIAPGQTVKLEPGGYHVMLIGLKRPLKAGEAIPATLTFQNAKPLKVQFNVEAVGALPKPMAQGMHDHMDMK